MGIQKAYLVGSGMGSLASAAYLIREGQISGDKIVIIEESEIVGGSLSVSGNHEKGYSLHGGRMLNFSYQCAYDLLSFIPSIKDPSKMVIDEIQEFNKKMITKSKGRLVKDYQLVDASSMGFSYKDRFDILDLMMRPEEDLGVSRIQDLFDKEFFETNFWYMWSTLFSFQPWHSAMEFKRYLHRFIHEFPRMNTTTGVDRTPYNQYDSIVRPLLKWLKEKGVHFMLETEVLDLEFADTEENKFVTRIHYRRNEDLNSIPVERDDLVFVTNGSATASFNLGSMQSAPLIKSKKAGADWILWENLAAHGPEFGRPSVFDNRVDESKSISFTVTLKDPLFFRLLEDYTGPHPGSGEFISLTDSNWLMSLFVPFQPYFLDQPDEVSVIWGYGLFLDRPGNFIKKKMWECTGEEILTELCGHLGFTNDLQRILQSSSCIPCMMPFMTSPLLSHKKTDRPQVIPEGFRNLAFVSQFCEIPDEVALSLEYSVRAAQMAVYQLLNLEKTPPPVFDSTRDLRTLFDSLRTMFREEQKAGHVEEPPTNRMPSS